MKIFQIKICFLLVILMTFVVDVQAQEMYEVTSKTLNVRSRPSAKASLIGRLRQHDIVDVVGKTNGWANVKYKNRYGYVSMQHLSKISQATVNEPKQTVKDPKLIQPITVQNKEEEPAAPPVKVDEAEDMVVFTDGSTMNGKIKEITAQGVVVGQMEDGDYSSVTIPTDAISLIEFANGEIRRFEKPSKPAKSSGLFSKNQNAISSNTGKDGKWCFSFLAGVQGGYSNFSCEISPKPTIGFGGFVGCQLSNVGGKPEWMNGYFAELTLGYAWKGSVAFPVHYAIARLFPIGWRLGAFNIKVGAFGAFPFNTLDTDYDNDKELDFGLTGGIGYELGRFGISATYEYGLSDVGTDYTKLKTQAAFLSLTYRIF